MPIPWKRNLSGASLTAQSSAENPAKKGKFKEFARKLTKFKKVESKNGRLSQLSESFDPSSSHMDWATSRCSSESSEDCPYEPEVRNGSPSGGAPPPLQYLFPETPGQYQQEIPTRLPSSQLQLFSARQNDFRQDIYSPFWRNNPTLMDARLERTESLSLERPGEQQTAAENEPSRSQSPSHTQVPITYNDAILPPRNFRLSTTSNRSRDSILGPSSTNCSELDVTKVVGLSKELSGFDAPFEEDDQLRSVTVKAQLDDLVEAVEPAPSNVVESTKQRRRRSLLSEGFAAARSQEFTGSVTPVGPVSSPRGFLSELGHLKEENHATGAQVISGSAEIAAQDSTRPLKCPTCSSSFPGMNRLKQHVKRKHLVPFQCPICQIRHDSSEMRRHYTNQHGFLKGTQEYEILHEQTKDRLAWYKNRLISPKGSGYEVICRILRSACVEQLRAMPEFPDLEPQLESMPEFTEIAPPLATALRASSPPILRSDLNAPEDESRVLSPQSSGTTTGVSTALLDTNAEIGGLSVNVQVGLQIPNLTKVVEELANDIRENLRMCSDAVQREKVQREYFARLEQLVMPLVGLDNVIQDPDQFLDTMTCDPDHLQHDNSDARVAFAVASPGAPMGELTSPSPRPISPRQLSQPIPIPQPRNSLASAISPSPPSQQSSRSAQFQSASTSFNSTRMSDDWDNYPEVPTTLATSCDNKTKLVPEFNRKPVLNTRPVVPSEKDDVLFDSETSDSQGERFMDDLSSVSERDDWAYILRDNCRLFDSDF